MMAKSQYDVIVAGAGPAGLSIASELSRFVKVLVLDKKPDAGYCERSWFVPTLVMDEADIPDDCHSDGVRRFICDTASQTSKFWDAELPRGYRFLKERPLLTYFDERVMKHGSEGPGKGSTVLYGVVIYNHEVENSKVQVMTSVGDFEARLLIDASGHDSPIKKAYHDLWEKEYYWWSVYGWIVHHPKMPSYPFSADDDHPPEEMKVGDYMLWGTFDDLNADPDACLEKGRPVMEWEILDEHTSFPMVLYLRRSKVSIDVMKAQFEQIIDKETLGKPFRVGSKEVIPSGNSRKKHIKEIKYGWYPSGGLSQGLAVDRVAFVGDAGVWTTPCGWGMAFILTNYRKYAQHIAQRVKEDRLDAHTLKSYVKMAQWERLQIIVDKIAAHFLSHVPPQLIDRFIDFWNSEGVSFLDCEKIFTLSVSMDDLERILKRFIVHFGAELPLLIKSFPVEDFGDVLRAAGLWNLIGWRRAEAVLHDMVHTLAHDWERPIRESASQKAHRLVEDLEILLGKRPFPLPPGNGFDFLDYKRLHS